MNFKKVLVGALASTMVMGMSVSAFADESLGIANKPVSSNWEGVAMIDVSGDVSELDSSWQATKVGTSDFVKNLDAYEGIKVTFTLSEEDLKAVKTDYWKLEQVMKVYGQKNEDGADPIGEVMSGVIRPYSVAYGEGFKAGTEYTMYFGTKAIKEKIVEKLDEAGITDYHFSFQSGHTTFTIKDMVVSSEHAFVPEVYWNDKGEPTEYKPASEATCTSEGYTGDYYCAFCGEKKKGTVIEKKEHTLATIPAVAATCETKGSTEGSKCTVCETVVKAPTEVAALGHSYDEGVVTTPATCEEDGVKTFTCQNDQTHTKTEVIPATGHDFGKDGKAVVCANGCGIVNPLFCLHENGAKLNEKSVIKATCTGDGYTGNMICDDCHGVVEEGKVIPALGHKVVDIPAVEATCAKDGATVGKKCEVCGDITVAPEVVKATGKHEFKDGKCTVCGVVDPAVKPNDNKAEEKGDVAPIAVMSVVAMLGMAVAFKARKRA